MIRRHAAALLALAATLHAPPAVGAQVPPAEYARRRAALAEQMKDGSAMLALGADEPVQDYLSFYQSSPFRYLTGWVEPSSALVMAKRGGQATGWLFVQRKDPSREVWSGLRAGPEGAAARTGLAARPADELGRVLDSLIAGGASLAMVNTTSEAGAPPVRDREVLARIRERHPKVEVASLD